MAFIKTNEVNFLDAKSEINRQHVFLFSVGACGWGSSLAHRIVTLEEKLYSTLSPGERQYSWPCFMLRNWDKLWPYGAFRSCAPCAIFCSHLLNCHHQIGEFPQPLMWCHLLSELQLDFSSCQNAVIYKSDVISLKVITLCSQYSLTLTGANIFKKKFCRVAFLQAKYKYR